MHTAIGSILRSSTKKVEDKINVLTFSTHERYQSNMSDINANFWLINNHKIKKWDYTYANVPKNHYVLNNVFEISDIPKYIEFDIVLSQSRFSQFLFSKKISEYLKIPHVCLEHTVMTDFRQKFKNLIADHNIFISDYSAKSWMANYEYDVVEHGIDSVLFHNKNIKRENVVLSVVNDWINRDFECGFSLWKEITKNFPTKVIGNTPNLSEPAKDIEELIQAYNKSLIFLNTSIHSPIPTSLLEAMACGCCVISTKNPMIENVITNNENGFISNNKNELIEYIDFCLKNTDKCKEIGKKARQTIIEKFSLNNFTKKWNSLLLKTLRN